MMLNDTAVTQLKVSNWLRTFCAGVAILLSVNVVASAQEIPRVDQQGNTTLAEDLSEKPLPLYGDPYEKKNAGTLIKAGCLANGSQHTRFTHRSATNTQGSASVQIAIHHDDYKYVIHDFYGVFNLPYFKNKPPNNAARDHQLGTPPSYLGMFVDRSTNANDLRKTVFFRSFSNPPEKAGLVGWYWKSEGTISTVLIGFEHLSAPPWALVDEYLKKYPSDVTDGEPFFAEWEANDIKKWINLLTTEGDDKRTVNMAAVHLRRYDRRGFGLHGVLSKLDPAERKKVFDAAIKKLEFHLDEREKTK